MPRITTTYTYCQGDHGRYPPIVATVTEQEGRVPLLVATPCHDHAYDTDNPFRCGEVTPLTGRGVALCTRPLGHGGPHVDRVHDVTFAA